MATWARALVQGSHNAINMQREFSFRCIYQVCSFRRYISNSRKYAFIFFSKQNFFAFKNYIILIFPYHITGTAISIDCAFGAWLCITWEWTRTTSKSHLVISIWQIEVVRRRWKSNALFRLCRCWWRDCECCLFSYTNPNIFVTFNLNYVCFYSNSLSQELDMECCPKPVVFVLHNCLSAKIHSLT